MKPLIIFLTFLMSVSPIPTTSPIWFEEATFTIKSPDTTVCQRNCMNFDNSFISSVIVKSRNICKCIYVCKTCSKSQCNDMCLEDERLEGSRMDVCNFIDDICYSYKYVQEKK